MKKAALIPFDGYKEVLNDNFFAAPCYVLMRDTLRQSGIELHTVDWFDDPNEADALLCFEIPTPTNRPYRDLLSRFKGIKIAVVYECPAIKPFNHDPAEHANFDYVVTWNDAIVDGQKYHHFLWPQSFAAKENPVPFAEKKMVSMIVGNKMVDEPHELYTERRRAIRFLERNLKDGFDLYGRPRWDQPIPFSWRSALLHLDVAGIAKALKAERPYTSYRGEVDNKMEVLSRYRFSVCYENMDHINGYVTEKIWDCLTAGTVPIYLGADNITDLIPKDCYIDKRDFPRYEDLLSYLVSLDEQRYNDYLSSAREFLKSDRAKPWSHEEWGPYMGELLAKLIGAGDADTFEERWQAKAEPGNLEEARERIAQLYELIDESAGLLRAARGEAVQSAAEIARFGSMARAAEEQKQRAESELAGYRTLLHQYQNSDSFRLGYSILHPWVPLRKLFAKERHSPGN